MKYQQEVLELCEVPINEIKVLNVEVGQHDGKPIYMNTIIVGKSTLPKMVWIHGYGASNALYF